MRPLLKCLILVTAILFSANVIVVAQDFENNSPQRQQIHTEDINKLSPLEILEDSLVYFADSMYNSPIPENRVEGNEYFIRLMKRFLRTEGSFQHANKKLSQKINIISSPDNVFKIYNWEVVQATDLGRYYGVIQLSDGQLRPLIDISDKIIRGTEDSTFANGRWFGCIYYNILQREIAGQQIYFLLGWNGNSLNSERKIVEAFGFNSQGQIQFGAPLFVSIERGKRKNVNRFVLEYQRGAKVSMNFDKETNQIIMDHCESQIGDPAKRYTYIPDGTYDGLTWDGTKWIMSENVLQIQDLQQGNAPIDKPIK
jgi:hypothetical protein